MTGPEHYRTAEGLLGDVTMSDGTIDVGDGGTETLLAAQVHAQLAHVAALTYSTDVDHRSWGEKDPGYDV